MNDERLTDNELLRILGDVARSSNQAAARADVAAKTAGNLTTGLISFSKTTSDRLEAMEKRLGGQSAAIGGLEGALLALLGSKKPARERRDSRDTDSFPLIAGASVQVPVGLQRKVGQWVRDQAGKVALALALYLAGHVAMWLGVWRPRLDEAQQQAHALADAQRQVQQLRRRLGDEP